ncbi:T-complex protein 11-like protein 1 [Gigantopelta aegis]|uniref:T-complex protein 11-like protein 1 n=1 Tax=Gigantopelta aegis TaxID=1735272 RepID=UPI001B889732|nr:T-complex protein 11-like protein 1 [Gigantopelta aegis]
MADNNETAQNKMNKDGGGSSENGDCSTSQNGSNLEEEAKKRRTRTPSPNSPDNGHPQFTVPASPPKFITFEQLMAAADGVEKMKLAHEIVVNGDFKLEPSSHKADSFQKQVSDIVHKAFWDCLKVKLAEDPPDYSQALELIKEVKQVVFSLLLPQHARFRAQIDEILDLDLIKQKIDNDAFDIYYYSNYVIGVMARLCAPIRDDQIAALKEKKEIIPLFREIFSVLDLMKMDMANFTIQQMRPYLQQQSVEYEQTKFKEFLKTQEENGIDGLQYTKMWLKRNFEKLYHQEQTSIAGASGSNATPASIMNEAYMELLQWDQEKQLFPETLLMDQLRLNELQKDIGRLSLIASILLITYSTVGESIAGIKDLKAVLKSHITTILEDVSEAGVKTHILNVGEQVKKEVNNSLLEHGFPILSESVQKALVGQITEMSSTQHPVHQLMLTRVLSFIKESIISQQVQSLKVPVGFSAVECELTKHLGNFLRLISHNRSVFGAYYADIISTLLSKQQDLSPA